MRKLLTKVAIVTSLASVAQAGAIVDLEIGGGNWSTGAPTGTIETSGIDVDLATQANLGSSDNFYMWAVIDHAIPVIPNIRIEQTSLKSEGSKNLSIPGLFDTAANIDTTLDMSHTDYIAYWGIPFATWLPFIDELDIGFGAKVFDGSLSMVSPLKTEETSYSGVPVPYGYGKLRVQPPMLMGVGFEGELKYISYDASSFSEVIAKIDWGFLAPLPVLDIEAGVELGYRSMSLNVDTSDLKADIAFDGIFFGVYGKFGI